MAVAIASEPATVSAVRFWRFRDVWPVAGLVFAGIVNAAWVAFLGYGLLELVGLAL
jgi:hypothetical protein